MCEVDVPRHASSTTALLDSLRVRGRVAAYHSQSLFSNGVLLKAADRAQPETLVVAAQILNWMLGSSRSDFAHCLPRVGAALAIIPRDDFVTALPEFAWLGGQADFTGRTYDSFELRGLGAVRRQPVTATSEERLLGIGVPRDLNVTVHEFAHAIQNLCFTPEDHRKWSGFYSQALQADFKPGSHLMHDVYEFFAVFSSAYFGVTDELGNRSTSRDTIRNDFPDIFRSLTQIYGSPGPLA